MFFPILRVLDLEGFLELSYVPANNWETRESRPMNVYAIWPYGDFWRCELHCTIKYGESFRITSGSLDPEMLKTGICLFYPTVQKLKSKLNVLPSTPYWHSNIPEWRCTSGFYNDKAQTSYQSEIFPLPSKASMLTFHPFIQFNEIKNYLLVINVIREPNVLSHKIDLFNSVNLEWHGSAPINTNSASIVDLDSFGFTREELPLFLSQEMAGIPFGLGIAKDGSMLSLEHTHPPASLVLFGNRNEIQSKIKKIWLQRLGKSK